MNSFAVIEVDDGFTVVEVMSGQSPEDTAAAAGAVIDAGPYSTTTTQMMRVISLKSMHSWK